MTTARGRTTRRALHGGTALAFVLVAASACDSFSATDVTDDADASAGAGDGASPTDAADGAAPPDVTPAEQDGSSDPDAGGPLIAFVTMVGYADITSPASADTRCVAEAAGRLPGKFVAWFSSSLAPAPSRLVDTKGAPVEGPWFRPDGKRIVASRAALLNTMNVPLDNPITVTAIGETVNASTWTATLPDGSPGIGCPGVTPTTGSSA